MSDRMMKILTDREMTRELLGELSWELHKLAAPMPVKDCDRCNRSLARAWHLIDEIKKYTEMPPRDSYSDQSRPDSPEFANHPR